MHDMMGKLECERFVWTHAFEEREGDGRRFKVNHMIGVTPITPFVSEISGVKIESAPVITRWNPIDLETLALGIAQTVFTSFHLDKVASVLDSEDPLIDEFIFPSEIPNIQDSSLIYFLSSQTRELLKTLVIATF
jgi:hypothetical protein